MDVPRNVAMHQPCTRVICREGKHEPSAGRQKCRVATHGVIPSEFLWVGVPIEQAYALPKNVEVMAVEMDGMRDGNGDGSGLLDDPIGPL